MVCHPLSTMPRDSPREQKAHKKSKIRKKNDQPRKEPVKRMRPTQSQVDFFKTHVAGYRNAAAYGNHGSKIDYIKEKIWEAFEVAECFGDRQLTFVVRLHHCQFTRVLTPDTRE